MRLVVGIAAVCFVLGCGDDGGGASPRERLDGHWVRDDVLSACLRMLAFENGVLVNQRICELSDGTFGAEIYVSTFDADSDSIMVYPEESSCAGVSVEPHELWFQIDGSELTLGLPEGVLLYERSRESRDSDDGQLGGAVAFGCFDEAGFFTPQPVRPI